MTCMIFRDSSSPPLLAKDCNEAVGMVFRLERESKGKVCRINLDCVALWSAQWVAPKLTFEQQQDLAAEVLDKIAWLLTTECEGEA